MSRFPLPSSVRSCPEWSPSIAPINDSVLGRLLRLAIEEVGDSRRGVELELLIGVELELT